MRKSGELWSGRQTSNPAPNQSVVCYARSLEMTLRASPSPERPGVIRQPLRAELPEYPAMGKIGALAPDLHQEGEGLFWGIWRGGVGDFPMGDAGGYSMVLGSGPAV